MRMMSVMGRSVASAGDRGQCHGAAAIGVSVYTGAGELTSDNEG